jgi:Myb-like DNA-binding domain
MTGVNAWIRWTPEEEKRLLNLIAAGKSWTLISGSLKRSMKSVKFHAKTLAQKRPPRAEGEGKMTNDRMPGPTR